MPRGFWEALFKEKGGHEGLSWRRGCEFYIQKTEVFDRFPLLLKIASGGHSEQHGEHFGRHLGGLCGAKGSLRSSFWHVDFRVDLGSSSGSLPGGGGDATQAARLMGCGSLKERYNQTKQQRTKTINNIQGD